MLDKFAEIMIKIKEFIIIFKNLLLTILIVGLFSTTVYFGVKYSNLKKQFIEYKYGSQQQITDLTNKYRKCRNENLFLNEELSKTMISLSEQNAIIEKQLDECRAKIKNNKELDKQLQSVYINLRRLTNSVYDLHKTLEEQKKQNERHN